MLGDTDAPSFRNNEGTPEERRENRKLRVRFIRSLTAFWILGVCNNFGISAMLAGAVNIIEVNENAAENGTEPGKRDCTMSSTGVILVAQYVGAVGTTMIAPFLPMLIHCRMICCLLMYVGGFLLVAFITEYMEVAMVGVALVSISSALGEVTLLQYAAYFTRVTLSTFSSGTGAAGVLGALSYTLGVEQGYKYTMLGMTSIPIIMGLVFWFLLPIPTEEDKLSVSIQRAWNEREVKTPWMIIVKKYYLIPKVFCKYIAPLGSVYLFEYFINQGLYELIKVEDKLVEKHMQYQWLQVAYQVGVFVSRSSVNCIYIKYIWIMALFQFFNVIIFTTAAIYMYISIFWVLFALAIEEGLFGGAAYVNTFVRIGREEAEEEKQFMSSMTCFGNNASIMLAGFLAILAHNLICKLPQPSEM
ncbi:battenin-like isoform X2 [Coccinella septempunctata]|uniref:battenin-like isoform X2 n=1 Tax=Coccinella septempunctata TaxID=41139 RepID=UPI001D081E9A|nr:battenin-like isoform X2 [Coccinella septempunctata]